MDNNRTKEEFIAHQITDAVNGSFDPEAFCQAMGHEHRTLQQSFMREIVVPFIRYAASKEYGTDDRNEDTHELAVYLTKCLDDSNYGLAYI